MWNNAASVRNLNGSYKIVVFQNSDYRGASDTLFPNESRNLVNTTNDNASVKWIY